jgi:uncharacterized coiled-coil protein SlyX
MKDDKEKRFKEIIEEIADFKAETNARFDRIEKRLDVLEQKNEANTVAIAELKSMTAADSKLLAQVQASLSEMNENNKGVYETVVDLTKWRERVELVINVPPASGVENETYRAA